LTVFFVSLVADIEQTNELSLEPIERLDSMLLILLCNFQVLEIFGMR
jgi:hypothetical protein